jgi:predicted alpha/beta-fold hydrolase
MKFALFISLLICPYFACTQAKAVVQFNQYPPAEKVVTDFKALLQRPAVDFGPLFQTIATDTVLIEKGFIYSEATEKVPILIYKPLNKASKSFPVVICLHGTGGNKEDESIKNLLYQFSKIGIMGVAIDARYHGERIPAELINRSNM